MAKYTYFSLIYFLGYSFNGLKRVIFAETSMYFISYHNSLNFIEIVVLEYINKNAESETTTR